MPEGRPLCPRRHDLVRVEPAVWTACLDARRDLNGLSPLAAWSARGWPLIVRRFLHDEAQDQVPLGLPLPPALGKRRLCFSIPEAQLAPVAAPALVEVFGTAPVAWHPTMGRLAALGERYGITPRPFGSLLWAALTGLPYLSGTSDLDLLWPLTGEVSTSLLDGIAQIEAAAPMRLDGELVLADGAGINWRELHGAGARGGMVLAKHLDRLEMRRAAAITRRRAA